MYFSSASAASSLKEVEAFGNSLNAESDLQPIVLSEKFQHSLLVMERSILGNTFQPKLAAYRQLPVLEGKLSSLSHGLHFFHFRSTDTLVIMQVTQDDFWTGVIYTS